MVRAFAVASLALVMIGAACSYSPHPEDGKQECYGEQCPDGYLCQADNKCWSVGHGPLIDPGTGGVANPGSGGTPGTGGVLSSGGIIGFGGISTGGIRGTGGVVAVGGSTGAGGTPPNSGTVVTISNYQAQGAMTGFGWVALAEADTVSDPTCNLPAGPITSGVPCDDTAWSSPTAYCVTGALPALSVEPSQSEFDKNWGIQLGISATPVSGGGLRQSFTGMTILVTGTPQTGLRAVVHRSGDAANRTYCALMSPGVPVLFSAFNTQCWGGAATVYLTSADVPTIDQISVMVPSTSAAVSVRNLCVAGITFGR